MSEIAASKRYEDGETFLSSTADIVDDLRNGRMVILTDAEDRENEGDLIIPAQMATPDAVNFMATHGRGLICLTLSEARAQELRLSQMVRDNASRNRTAFTQSIEAREGISTGISAHDRARTIATAIDPTKDHNAIVSPGHIFPLKARDGGVLMRAGHTEASVDLCRIAGLYPAAVICEIMNDDGTMARIPDLIPFAQRHALKIGTIADLIAYRLRNDSLVEKVTTSAVTTTHGGAMQMHIYRTTLEPAEEHVALVAGDVTTPEPVLVRVHAVNPLVDLAGVDLKADNEAAPPLIAKSLATVREAGRGVVVLIRDLAPTSLTTFVESQRASQTPKSARLERRQVEIGIGSQILSDLGVRDMILMTNSPAHVYVGLEAFGLTITDTQELI
ncbi:MAG: 3,4-dihydroxy-2-butanone-4-phosphate synthase [Pseudomonadota bacterium]